MARFCTLILFVLFLFCGCKSADEQYNLYYDRGFKKGYQEGLQSQQGIDDERSKARRAGIEEAKRISLQGYDHRVYLKPAYLGIIGGVLFGVIMQYIVLLYCRSANVYPKGFFTFFIPNFESTQAAKLYREELDGLTRIKDEFDRRELELQRTSELELSRLSMVEQTKEQLEDICAIGRDIEFHKRAKLLTHYQTLLLENNCNEFLLLLQLTGLGGHLKNPKTSTTLFVPTDKALEPIRHELFREARGDNKARVSDWLCMHIFKNAIVTQGVQQSKVETISGKKGTLHIGRIHFISCDIATTQGFIHTLYKPLIAFKNREK